MNHFKKTIFKKKLVMLFRFSEKKLWEEFVTIHNIMAGNTNYKQMN